MTGLGLAVALVGVASCGDSGDGDGTGGADSAQTSGAGPGATEGPDGAAGTAGPDGAAATEAAPDLSDVPDVVAEVNGTKISKEDFTAQYEGSFQQAQMQAQMSGQPVDEAALKEQTVQGMVSNELLLQAADEANYQASEKDVKAELDELAASNGLGSGEEFVTALEEQGMTTEEVNEEVVKKIKVDQLIAEDAAPEEPTEKEIKELYDTLVEQQGGGGTESGSGGGMPAYEEVKDQLAEQVKSEKENQAIQGLVEELRADADVKIHL
jgi:peptidyl-prolyl cis-trans isomerase SurA